MNQKTLIILMGSGMAYILGMIPVVDAYPILSATVLNQLLVGSPIIGLLGLILFKMAKK